MSHEFPKMLIWKDIVKFSIDLSVLSYLIFSLFKYLAFVELSTAIHDACLTICLIYIISVSLLCTDLFSICQYDQEHWLTATTGSVIDTVLHY